jgi:hypothetical protein
MYTLFTDKTELFECDLQLEGASLKKSFARLLIESENLNLVFKGEISSSGKCKIPVKRLRGLLDENVNGKIKLEVIAEDTYFTPWEDDFKVDTSKKVTVEVKSQKDSKPILEMKPKVSVKKNTKKVSKPKKRNHSDVLVEVLKRKDVSMKNIVENRKLVNNVLDTYIRKFKVNPKRKNDILEAVIDKLY